MIVANCSNTIIPACIVEDSSSYPSGMKRDDTHAETWGGLPSLEVTTFIAGEQGDCGWFYSRGGTLFKQNLLVVNFPLYYAWYTLSTGLHETPPG